jgi:hypothetical protein
MGARSSRFVALPCECAEQDPTALGLNLHSALGAFRSGK